MKRVGVVGARGHVGSELLPMLLRHTGLELSWVTSSSAAGTPIAGTDKVYHAADPDLLRREPVDALILALPNGQAPRWAALAGDAVVVDLSADHRFDAAWIYGQIERFRPQLRGAKRIAAPGCYATAAQLAIAPWVQQLAATTHVFGVSGYSGAGTAPSERNDPEVLRDNLLPYALVGHTHERELRRHLGCGVVFMPHVASFFRGLSVTVSMELREAHTLESVQATYAAAYGHEPFVTLTEAAPYPRDAVGTHGVRLGGFALGDDGRHLVVVSTLDNLLGGAASQALRGLNLALGCAEDQGLRP